MDEGDQVAFVTPVKNALHALSFAFLLDYAIYLDASPSIYFLCCIPIYGVFPYSGSSRRRDYYDRGFERGGYDDRDYYSRSYR